MSTIDYTTIRSDGNYPKDGSELNRRWWLSNKTDRAKDIHGTVLQLTRFDSVRQNQYALSDKLYGNTELRNITGLQVNRNLSQPRPATKERLTYNVVQSAVDTVTAKISKNKPKPLFLTSGGDWKLQRRAKKLDKFVQGVFYENDSYHLGIQAFRDGATVGDGLIQVFEHEGRVKHERVDACDLYVDWYEGYYGNPRQLHRVKNLDRAVLIDLFPEKKTAILRANSASMGSKGASENIADQVTVIESWHLPSGKDAGDGLHTICLEDESLFEEEWKKPFFPFARFSWAPRRFGYWAQGAAEQLQNIQYEINKILYLIQRSIHLAGTYKILLKIGSKVPKEHFNNEIGAILEYQGDTPPQYITPPAVPVEFYQQLQNLKTAAFEQVGVSMLSAASQKPAGLNSGKALREYNDIESDRFTTIGQAYERFYLDLARLSVDCAKDIYEREGAYEVKVPGKKFIETIDWKDIDLTEDEYFLKIFPVSSLPDDPSGRLQTVQEYTQAGFIDPMTAPKLLDFPDLEQFENLNQAMEDWIISKLEEIADKGQYAPPEPEMVSNYPMAKKLAIQYIANAHNNNLEEQKIALLRQFSEELDRLNLKANPPPMVPGPGGAPGAAPLANPQATPTSDLIQNTAGAA